MEKSDFSTDLAPSLVRARETRSDIARRIAEVEEPAMALVEQGNSVIISLIAAGIPRRTAFRWRMSASNGDPELEALFERLDRASAKAEADLVAILRNPPKDEMGRSDNAALRAVQFVLERTRRERWGQQKQETASNVAAGMRELLDTLERRMSPEGFNELTRILASVEDELADP